MSVRSPYLQDIFDQPAALERFSGSASSIKELIGGLGVSTRPRVIVSGMGSSHFAGRVAWRTLVAAGIPAWWIEGSELLDVLAGMAIPGTLLWLTSQSGESAEITALLERDEIRNCTILGFSNNPESTLARRSDVFINLYSGPEATVSTKSYSNSIAAQRIASNFAVGNNASLKVNLEQTVVGLQNYLDDFESKLSEYEQFTVINTNWLLAGRGDAIISCLTGSLIIKEAAKFPTEGLSAAALRHGPIELAGSKLTTVFFNHDDSAATLLNTRLAENLLTKNSRILWIGSSAPVGSVSLAFPSVPKSLRLIADALAFQTLSVVLAKKQGLEAGKFEIAAKITNVL